MVYQISGVTGIRGADLVQGKIRAVPGGEVRLSMDAVTEVLGLGASFLPLKVVRVPVNGAEGKPRERLRGILMLAATWEGKDRHCHRRKNEGGPLTQGLDVQRPLLIIFDKVGDIETRWCDGLSTGMGRSRKTGTRDSDVSHIGIDNDDDDDDDDDKK